jgi:myo-inositol-1(or 4)-monophosphatase
MLDAAIDAATAAGKFLKKNLGHVRTIERKGGEEKNLVTEIDKGSEAIIIDILRKRYPAHDILAEESGGANRRSDYRWVIDPLDGTTNYTHGLPVFCVSIALEWKGAITLGVIYDPNADELFTAEQGRGAKLNGRRMKVSSVARLAESLLVTGFPYSITKNPDRAIEHFISFLMAAQAVRRMGSAAIDLAYVAAGRYEGFWEVMLNPWDTAAGMLLVTEAGGEVTGFTGEPYSIYDKAIVASNGPVHPEMLQTLARTR